MANPFDQFDAAPAQPFTIGSPDPYKARADARAAAKAAADAKIEPWRARKVQADALTAEANLKKLQAGTQMTPDKLESVRRDAVNKIITARMLKDRSQNEWFATGFLAPTMSQWGGTNARGVQAGADTLKAGGALAEVLKLTAANGGKNPFQPMSNSDVELISRNTANLDIGQPDKDFQNAVQQYENAYHNAFIGAGGNEGELERYVSKKIGAKKRGMFGGHAVPQSGGVIDFNDLPE
ncbi:hypothetical protein [Rhizorhapis sp.]|uniref:hypothetical protein n=1 Tax=Rhizorhapis sp. TaxID=1968842 RepID=UPI002B4749DA|nr:hypothetical protein [Rhizorhapis sp.]HKR17662.1 hypothetical protein [Rhizorhapis sp.]